MDFLKMMAFRGLFWPLFPKSAGFFFPLCIKTPEIGDDEGASREEKGAKEMQKQKKE